LNRHKVNTEDNRKRRSYSTFAQRPVWQKYTFFLALLILLLGALGSVTVYNALHKTKINLDNVILDEKNVETIGSNDSEDDENTAHLGEQSEDFYSLIIGLDYSGSHNGINTDTLLVAHVIPQLHIVKLLSVPRDLRVRNLQGEDAKINSMFASGYNHAARTAKDQPELLSGKQVQLGQSKVPEEYVSSGMVVTRETLERYMGIEIKYSFLTTFQTLSSLVDAVGGIEIEVERKMVYDAPSENMHIRLEPGLQVLNGETALHYARFRKDNRGESYHSNDFERGLRQQKVIQALVDKMTSWNSLPKALDIVDIVASNLKTDMQPSTMISLLNEFYGKIGKDDLYSLSFPGYWNSPYVDIKQEQLDELLNKFTSLDYPE